MSQYGGQQQQYGGQNGVQQDPSQSQGQQQYGGQDASQQDPSQSQYGGQQDQSGYGQQDPSQQDPSQSQYGGQQDQAGTDGQTDPSQQQQDPSQYSNTQQGFNQPMKDPTKDHRLQHSNGVHHEMHKQHQGASGSGRQYDANHHNAMYHMSKVALGGFTKDHMESFIHLGTYALGALSNQHGLAPDAPRDPAEDGNQ